MKIAPVLLAAVLTISSPDTELLVQEVSVQERPYIVEDNYEPSGAYRIIKNKSNYDKITAYYGKERYKQPVQSTKEILSIPICLDVNEIDGIFLLPSEIDGVVMDIPYNYYSNRECSSRYFQTLLYNNWEIDYYNATSLCVQIGLVKDGVVCRLLIYENYLKVYCKLI